MSIVTTTRHPIVLSPLQGKEQGGLAGASTLKFRDLRLQSHGRKAKSYGQTSGHIVSGAYRGESGPNSAFSQHHRLTSRTLDGLLLRVPFTKVGVWFVSLKSGVVELNCHPTDFAGNCLLAGPPCPIYLNGQPMVGLFLVSVVLSRTSWCKYTEHAWPPLWNTDAQQRDAETGLELQDVVHYRNGERMSLRSQDCSWAGHLLRVDDLPQDKEPDPNCPLCGGSGVCDSGGTTPWGEGIDIRCSCTYVNPQGVS